VQGALIIALQREDVVLPGDLALRKAVGALLPGKARQNRIDSSR
jgi:3-methyladenine DNA glycosylase/8-oxoguanine DNA glycosylase